MIIKVYVALDTVFQTEKHALEALERSDNEYKEAVQIKYGIISNNEYRKFIDFYYWEYDGNRMKGLSLEELNIKLYPTEKQAKEELDYIAKGGE